MVILHNAIKTIQNGVLCFFEKRTKTRVFSKIPKKPEFEKNRRVGIF